MSADSLRGTEVVASVGAPATAMRVPSEVAAFRAEYRAAHIGRHYNGWLHFGFTSSAALAAIAVALAQVAAPSALELAIVPLAFVVANFGEYFGHRGPMHHPTRALGILFRRHARQHHRFYTAEAMPLESSRDLHMVLFPPAMIVFFLVLGAVPLSLLVRLLATANASWLFFATVMGYFLTYEWLHLAYHMPPDSAVGRLGVVRALRRLHSHHHDPALLQRYNFNITFPIADTVLGTRYRGAAAESVTGRGGARLVSSSGGSGIS
jgi:hypothetical protein